MPTSPARLRPFPFAPSWFPFASSWPILAWALLVASALIWRPLLPIDETRYLSVAWDMWRHGDWLALHVNGQPYSDKPPLLFWLIDAGWLLVGAHGWWARLVAPLAGLATLFLTAHLGRRLWPGEAGAQVARLAPVILLGTLLWTLFTTLTMFDTLVAFFAVLGLEGLVLAGRGRGLRGFALLGVAIGLGVLSKGPVILVYLLPAALLAPLWLEGDGRPAWRGWYLGTLGAVLLGAAIALAWALPAAQAGGPAYADQILWHQTSGRMVQSFAHRRPFWWYLPLLPALLFPWALWPSLWRGVGRAFRAGDGGLRLCLICFCTGLIVFSAVSGKQVHYLLPLLPAVALLLARSLTERPPSGREQALASLVLAFLGLFLVAAPYVLALRPDLAGHAAVPPWFALVAVPIGIGLALLGFVVWRYRPSGSAGAVRALALLSIGALLLVQIVGMPKAAADYDVVPAARILHRIESQGRPIAFVGAYHAEFQFTGRLTRPIAVIPPSALKSWVRQHPNGVVVLIKLDYGLPPGQVPLYISPDRGRTLVIWTAAALAGAGGA